MRGFFQARGVTVENQHEVNSSEKLADDEAVGAVALLCNYAKSLTCPTADVRGRGGELVQNIPGNIVPKPYLASSLPDHTLAELHRLMTEEIKEVAVFFLNVEGIITAWIRAAEEMNGFTAQDAIGSHLRLLYLNEDKARG